MPELANEMKTIWERRHQNVHMPGPHAFKLNPDEFARASNAVNTFIQKTDIPIAQAQASASA